MSQLLRFRPKIWAQLSKNEAQKIIQALEYRKAILSMTIKMDILLTPFVASSLTWKTAMKIGKRFSTTGWNFWAHKLTINHFLEDRDALNENWNDDIFKTAKP